MRDATVLIVDDEPNAIRVLSAILKSEGYNVLESLGVDRAISTLEQNTVDAVITDIKMPGRDGYSLFDYMSEHLPHIPTIFLTAYGTVDSAVQAVSNGAFYYFIKPPDYQQLKKVLAKAVERNVRNPDGMDHAEHGSGHSTERLIGRSAAMKRILTKLAAIKDSESSVLLCGETGTGKEVLANYLHFCSDWSAKPFVAVNCAAIPRELLESELFGYEKGAFTGANSSRMGKFEEASGGTLFLDEIGELEPALQAKLLRVLQERTIHRLGSNKNIKVDFRLICSTNRDLKKEMEIGSFRKDLFYRINVVSIEIPPLRERREDMSLLIVAFLQEFCARQSKKLSLSDEVMTLFLGYSWPGNVRQLKNVIEHAVVMSKGPAITVHDLPDDMRGQIQGKQPSAAVKSLRAVEVQAVANALRECNGNKSLAARKLGISRKALYARLKESGTQ
ncbi:MAG TPA: sigma-54 dependent transcriptional regulator [Nitrospirota bacterium]